MRMAALMALLLVLPAGLGAAPPSAGGVGSGEHGWRLLFSSLKDVTGIWGAPQVCVSPVRLIRQCGPAGFTPIAALPLADGAWELFGQVTTQVSQGAEPWQQITRWRLVRTITRDGVAFDPPQTLFEPAAAAWTDHAALARNPETGEYLLLKLKVDSAGFAYTAFFSPDGRQWREHPGNPLFYDGDSMSLFWSPVLRRFVCTNKSLQPFRKRTVDHGGPTPALHDDTLRDRRVLMTRSSADGRTWKPGVSLADVWNRNGAKAPIPDRYLTLPDAGDPPDLEFYSGSGFWYHDRAYMLVLNYAASPLMPGKHGPHLDNEWWTSRDGLRWERPARGVNALEPFPGLPRIETPPMVAGGQILFRRGDLLLGLPRDRITGISSRSNAEFTTSAFRMPAEGLALNAAIPSPDRAFAREQAYVMVAALDEAGHVIPGCEASACVLRERDGVEIPLGWTGVSARALAGRTVRLRFAIRSAAVYALTACPRR